MAFRSKTKKRKRSKQRQSSVSQLKKKAWYWYSRLVRYRARDSLGRCKCVTCGVKKPWKQMQGGHFIRRDYSAVFLADRNVHPQCARCNVAKDGEQYLYGEFLRKRYGHDTPDELWELAREGKQFTGPELVTLIEDYKAELEALGYGIDT